MTTEPNSVDEQLNGAQKQKRIVERSASYPSINLEDAVSFTAEVSKHFPTVGQTINRDDIAAVLNKVSATIQRDIAAASQFGFFTKQRGEGYQLTSAYKTLKNSLDEKERRKFLLQAFASPKLFVELIEKFDAHAVPVELKTHLIRFHNIAEKAAPGAADIFIQSAQYCGALTSTRILQYKQELEKVCNPNFQYAEIVTENKEERFEAEIDDIIKETFFETTTEQQQQHSNNQLIVAPPTEERLKIPLTEKKSAYLIYPSNINSKDIEILKKQIEVLELLVT
jgi:hypothetical protein